jgi:acyl carrier protein
VDLITEIEKTTGLEADILLFAPSEITTVEDLIHQLKQVFAS